LSDHIKKQLALQLLKKFRVVYGSVRQHFREVEQTCGVTGSQLWVMQEIANTPGIGVSELAARLSVHQSTCSQLVEKLVTSNLISKKRSKEDQRRVGLWLSEEAVELLEKAPGPAEGVLPKALRELPIETIQTLSSAMEKVIEQLQMRDEKLADKPLSDL
jgi:MarR family transcriptional regulator, organic hydroperoxide resistance regulator